MSYFVLFARNLPWLMQRATWPMLVPLSTALVLALIYCRHPIRCALKQQNTTIRYHYWVATQMLLLLLMSANFLCAVFLPAIRRPLCVSSPSMRGASPNALQSDTIRRAPSKLCKVPVHSSLWELFAFLELSDVHGFPVQMVWSWVCTDVTALIAQLAVARIVYAANGRSKWLAFVNCLLVAAAFVFDHGISIVAHIPVNMPFRKYITARLLRVLSDCVVWYGLTRCARTATSEKRRIMAAELLAPWDRAWWIEYYGLQAGLKIFEIWNSVTGNNHPTLSRTLVFALPVFSQNARVAVFFVMLRTYLQHLPCLLSDDAGPASAAQTSDTKKQGKVSEDAGSNQKHADDGAAVRADRDAD